MNLWWLITSSTHCRYAELKERQCIALGWSELGSMSKYVKNKPGWERQFKTFIQLRGNLAYSLDKQWTAEKQNLQTGVPALFWNLLKIREGDYIVVMETGNQMTLGNIEIVGAAKVTRDAMSSYRFDNRYHHAHQVCHGLVWQDWDRAKLGELHKPMKSFNSLTVENDQLDVVENALDSLDALTEA